MSDVITYRPVVKEGRVWLQKWSAIANTVADEIEVPLPENNPLAAFIIGHTLAAGMASLEELHLHKAQADRKVADTTADIEAVSSHYYPPDDGSTTS